MTLSRVPLLTTGADHSAQQFRMMIRDLARGNQGITEGDDLKVTALGTPGANVQVSDGSGTIRGQANSWQGSYTAYNIGAQNVAIASTGSSTRYDMVVLRVLDPEYEGGLDPAVDQIVDFFVVSNVASTATAPPAGMTAIPLARIAIPPSTSAITNGMITDLRQIANPRRTRDLYPFSPGTVNSRSSSSPPGGYNPFPGGPSWTVAVPTWATSMRISMRISGLTLSTAGGYGNVAGALGASVTFQPTGLDDNGTSGLHRIPTEVVDTVVIPPAYRGTSQVLSFTLALHPTNVPAVGSDTITAFIADVEFLEGPR